MFRTEASRGDVGGDQDRSGASGEGVEGAGALFLAAVAVNGADLPAPVGWGVGRNVRARAVRGGGAGSHLRLRACSRREASFLYSAKTRTRAPRALWCPCRS